MIYSMANDDAEYRGYLHGQGGDNLYVMSRRYLWLALWLLIYVADGFID